MRPLNFEKAVADVKVASSFADAEMTIVRPPYLRWNVPAERAKIEAIIRAARRRMALSSPSGEQTSSVSVSAIRSETGGPKPAGGLVASEAREAVVKRAKDRAIDSASAAQTATRVSALQMDAGATVQTEAGTANKVAAPPSIVPDGVVSIGWYCSTLFKVNCATGLKDCHYYFYLEFGPERIFLYDGDYGKMGFYLDGTTYNLGALASNGTLPIKVVCDIERTGGYPSVELPLTLNFINQTPCVELQRASFPDEQVPCELVGHNHGQRPKIRVDLTAPAGPSGQTVFLFLNDPHWDKNPVAHWAAADIDSFVIPYGQTSGEWEGFLNTRVVTSEKTISIQAKVNHGISQPLEIKVKRN